MSNELSHLLIVLAVVAIAVMLFIAMIDDSVTF